MKLVNQLNYVPGNGLASPLFYVLFEKKKMSQQVTT
jgi:hypothetical protein